MSDINDIQTGFRVATQVPLDKKSWFPTIASLIDLGLNNNLAFTYHEAMIAYCAENRLRYEWREAVGAEVGMLTENFTYPTNHIVFGINYSLKEYNFFETNLGGPQGPQGIQGVQGEIGPQGPQGVAGNNGNQGVAGTNGINGVNGVDGANGTNGATGLNNYQIALNNGYIGTEAQWLLSLKGVNGNTGPQGAQGLQGAQGVQGVQGIQGVAGQDYTSNLQKTITYPNDFTGVNYTVTNADNNHTIFIENGITNVNIIFPSGLMAKIQVGFFQKGSGDVLAVESGTTLKYLTGLGLKMSGIEANAYAEKQGSTEIIQWIGNIKA